jgi:signal peptidase II
VAARNAGSSTMLPWLGIAAIVILIDQLTKALILRTYAEDTRHVITGYFNLVHAHNPGAAFSFLAGAAGWQRWFFTALALGATAFILWMLKRHGEQKLFAWALALIMGGALGNLVDRLMHGYVIDFLEFHWRFLEPVFPGGYFPAFNMADSAITLGAALLIVDELLRVRRS